MLSSLVKHRELEMKLIVTFGVCVLVVDAVNDGALWENFKSQHSKRYKNSEEENHRFSIFRSNVRTIEEHNAKYSRGEETYFMNVNQFSDWTHEEFKRIYLGYKKPKMVYKTTFDIPKGLTVPDKIDWREKGAVLAVKNQWNCGSCWAFSTTGALEGQYVIKHNISLPLSAQQLIDCSKDNLGCDGGHMIRAFNYIMGNGIYTDESYPYTAWDGEVGRCQVGRDSGITLIGYAVVNSSENALKEAVGTVGPISIALDGENLSAYGGGIFNNPNCGQELNHGVLAVGYGSENGLDYWIVKNSWGLSWGENGYIKLVRNKNQQCGISMDNSFPILK